MKYVIQNIRPIIVLLFVFGLSSVLLAQADTDVKDLNQRVQVLEQALVYIKFVGGPVFGFATLWAVYMSIAGIKKKVNELVEKEAKTVLKPLVEKMVKDKIASYPFIQKFEAEQLVKQQKSIRVFGPTVKDIGLYQELEKQGFLNVKFYNIADADELDVNNCDVVLFNNRTQELMQEQMDEIVEQYKQQVHFFYLTHPDAAQWKSRVSNIGRIGFASSMQRIEPNLLKLFA